MKSQSGQAAIEYILLLVITVALILALVAQFFKPLQAFISSYMGDYTACLLQTGELPSLGDSDVKSALSDEGCNAQFQPASITNGRPPKTDGSNANTNANANKKSSDKSGGSSSTASTGSSSGGGGGGNYFGSRRGTRSGDSNGPGGKVVEIALDSDGGNSFFKSSNMGSAAYRPSKSISIGLSGLTESERKKLEKKENTASRIIATDGPGTPPKKSTVKPPEKKPPPADEDPPFTIGNFMRILFIVAIILALVIFVGGQVLQMSKSYDK